MNKLHSRIKLLCFSRDREFKTRKERHTKPYSNHYQLNKDLLMLSVVVFHCQECGHSTLQIIRVYALFLIGRKS